MATVSKLTANSKAVKDAGFVRDITLDFSDDGNKFIGFKYKDVPLTQCYSEGEVYLSVRYDYLMGFNAIPYDFYRTYFDTFATNKYNGTSEKVDLEDLTKICDQVSSAAKQCLKDFNARPVDREKAIKNVQTINGFTREVLEKVVTTNIFELNLTAHGLKEFYEYYNKAKTEIVRYDNLVEELKKTTDKSKIYHWEKVEVKIQYYAGQVQKFLEGTQWEYYYNKKQA